MFVKEDRTVEVDLTLERRKHLDRAQRIAGLELDEIENYVDEALEGTEDIPMRRKLAVILRDTALFEAQAAAAEALLVAIIQRQGQLKVNLGGVEQQRYYVEIEATDDPEVVWLRLGEADESEQG